MYDQLAPEDRFAGAGEAAIAAAERALATQFPADYRAFLTASDGYNGNVADHYLVLWSTEELIALATGYDMLPPGPNQVLIGSNGGPTAFAIIRGDYVSLPFDSGLQDMRVLADSFDGFLSAIAVGEGW